MAASSVTLQYFRFLLWKNLQVGGLSVNNLCSTENCPITGAVVETRTAAGDVINVCFFHYLFHLSLKVWGVGLSPIIIEDQDSEICLICWYHFLTLYDQSWQAL